MSQVPADLAGRVPTLTEVLELPEVQAALTTRALTAVPDLGQEAVAAPGRGLTGSDIDRLADHMMDALAPQMDALISSRLRDVLAPALQDAVEEVVDRFRGTLVEAAAAQLRELVQAELAQSLNTLQVPQLSPSPHQNWPDKPPGQRFP